MTLAEWADLSDGELRARLHQRGVAIDIAETLVWKARGHGNGCTRAAETITRVLEGRDAATEWAERHKAAVA